MFNSTFLLGSKYSLMYLENFERTLFRFSKIENLFLIGCAIIVSLVKNLFCFCIFARLRMPMNLRSFHKLKQQQDRLFQMEYLQI